jgi:RNA polymerase sigma-70 factor (ECF subfamily)
MELRVADDPWQVSRSEPISVADDAALDGKSLVLAFKRGEEGATETIYRRYCPMVHAICWRVLGNYHDAQEAAQETFLRVFRALPRFEGNYQLNSWITRIATNVCVDRLRFFGKRIQGEVQVETLGQTPSPVWDTDPEEIMMRKLEGTRVERVLSTLPPLHRAVMLLRDVYGLPYREIATSLDISEGQVKNCLHRGRKAFRGRWMEQASSWMSDLFLRSKLRGELLRASDGSLPTTARNVTAPGNAGDPLSWFNAVASASTAVPVEQAGHVVERVATTVAAAVVSIGAASSATPAPTNWQHSNTPPSSSVSDSPSIAGEFIRISSGGSDLDLGKEQSLKVIVSVERPTDQGETDPEGCSLDGELQVGSEFESPALSETGCAPTPPVDTAPLSGDGIVTDDVDPGDVAPLVPPEDPASESTGPSTVEQLPDAVEEEEDAVDFMAATVLTGEDPAENELTEGSLPPEENPDADAGDSDKSLESGIDGTVGDVAGTVEASADAMTYTAEELSSTLSVDAAVPSTSQLLGQ